MQWSWILPACLLWGILNLLPASRSSAWEELRILYRIVDSRESGLNRSGGRLYYMDAPFTGTLAEYHPGGALKSLGRFSIGKRHGLQQAWYSSGFLKERRGYQKSREEGPHREWWPNGVPKSTYSYREGRVEGPAWEWFESGRMFLSRNFHAGQEAGSQRAWGKAGEVYSNYVVAKGKIYGLVGSKLCYTVRN